MRLETDKNTLFGGARWLLSRCIEEGVFCCKESVGRISGMRLFSMALNGYDRSRNFIFDEVRNDDEELAAFGR